MMRTRFKYRALFALGVLLVSCNPLGSQSTINGGDGTGSGGTGLAPTFASSPERATSANPMPITVTWPSAVTGFSINDINITNGTPQNFSGSDQTYSFEVVPQAEGPVTMVSQFGAAQDAAGNLSVETTYILNYDLTAPTVTINRATSQAEHTGTLPVNFTVVFSEPINPTTFIASDITQSGTATGITWTITDSGDQTTFTLAATAISGIVGSLQPSLSAAKIADFAGIANTASTGTNTTAHYLPGYSSVKLWLRADALSLANGASVTSWTDSSGSLNHATEATNPPTFIASAQNSKPAISFNGSKLLRSTTNSGITGNPDFTVFLVSRINGTTAGYAALLQFGEDETSGANAWLRLIPSASQIFTGFYGGGSASVANYPAGFNLYTWVRTGGANTAQSGNAQFWNGASASVTANLSNPAVNITDGVFRIGRSTANVTSNADIAELIVFNGTAMSTSARGTIEAYLNAKYLMY